MCPHTLREQEIGGKTLIYSYTKGRRERRETLCILLHSGNLKEVGRLSYPPTLREGERGGRTLICFLLHLGEGREDPHKGRGGKILISPYASRREDRKENPDIL